MAAAAGTVVEFTSYEKYNFSESSSLCNVLPHLREGFELVMNNLENIAIPFFKKFLLALNSEHGKDLSLASADRMKELISNATICHHDILKAMAKVGFSDIDALAKLTSMQERLASQLESSLNLVADLTARVKAMDEKQSK